MNNHEETFESIRKKAITESIDFFNWIATKYPNEWEKYMVEYPLFVQSKKIGGKMTKNTNREQLLDIWWNHLTYQQKEGCWELFHEEYDEEGK